MTQAKRFSKKKVNCMHRTIPPCPFIFGMMKPAKNTTMPILPDILIFGPDGDFAEITGHGVIIYGRADALLKPSGVRIGTAEIYREIEKIPEIIESVAVGQEWDNNIRIILFVTLREGSTLTEELKKQIKTIIKTNASPHHVPAKIIAIPGVPRTVNGKIVEVAVREVIHGRPVKNISSIANAEVLEYYKNLKELKE